MTKISPTTPILISEIGFDFDGVVADTAEAFIRLACKEYGYCSFGREDITNFELQECLPIPEILVQKIFTDILVDSLAVKLLPMPGAIQCLERFTESDRVTIITARSLTAPVFNWLEHFCSESTMRKIRVVATGDHNDKVRHIHQHGLKYFVDDRAETCIQLAKEDIAPYVFSQPWNKNRHALPTVADWDEIKSLVTDAPQEEPCNVQIAGMK
jgi:uncharacterized protein